MRIPFFNLLGSILYSIFRAEDKLGAGNGSDKRLLVQKEILLKGAKEGFLATPTATFSPKIAGLIVELIEIIVELLHAFGIFDRKQEKPIKQHREVKE